MSLTAFSAGQRVRGLLLRRRLVDEIGRGRGRMLGLVLLGCGLGGVIFLVALGGGWFVRTRGYPELVMSGVTFGLWGLAGALVFSSLGHAAQAFFQARDLWLWDSAPTGANARFVDRLTQTAMAAAPPTVALGSLALMGLALGGGLGVGGAVRGLVAVFVIVPLPVCVGVILAHVGGAVLPAGQLRRISLLLLGCGVTAALVWFRQARIERLLTEQGANDLLQAAQSTSTDLGPALSPPRQLAAFVVDGDAAGFVTGAGTVAAIVLLALLSHRLLYDRARKLAVDESPTGVLRGSLTERALSGLVSLVAADLRPLVRKDLLAFVRDPGQWGQVVLLLGVGVLYIVNASALSDGLRVLMPPLGAVILVGAHVGIVGFVAGGLAARFAFPQVGLEGPAIWIIDGAPLSARRLLLAKWLSAFPVVVVFPALLALVGGVVLDFGPLRVLWSSALITLLAIGVAGAAVFRGAQRPLFDAASLSELAMGPGAVSTMVLATSLSFVASVCAFAAAGLLDYETGTAGAVLAAALTAVPLLATAVAARSAFARGVGALLERRSDDAAMAGAMTGARSGSEPRSLDALA